MKKIQFPFPAILMFAAMILTAMPWSVEAKEKSFLSANPDSRLSTIPHDPEMEAAIEESAIDEVVVLHEGWEETLYTFARLKIYELTGRQKIRGQNPIFTILSLMYEPGKWLDARFLPVEHPRVAEIMEFEGKWVSPRQVIENPNTDKFFSAVQGTMNRKQEYDALNKLLGAVEQAYQLGGGDRVIASFAADGVDPAEVRMLLNDKEELRARHQKRRELQEMVESEKPFFEASSKLVNRTRMVGSLHDQFLIVPDMESVEENWVRPASFGGGSALFEAGKRFDNALETALAASDPGLLQEATSEFLGVIENAKVYPSTTYRRLINLYTAFNPFRLSGYIYLVSAILFSLFFFFRAKPWYFAGIAAMGGGLLLHTGGVAARLYLTGHVPVSNMYESITFMSWAMIVLAVIFELWSRKGLVGLGGTIFGALFLAATALLPLHQTRLHPLRAVLDSYWLNIHVTMMLLSYAAFAIAAFFGLVYLVKHALGRESLFGGSPVMSLEQTELFAYRLVQVGWPILTLGVTLGAVWADTAWGRYWGWDPKETWAFITWVTYTAYLHARMVMGKKGWISALLVVLGFVMVLITWIGVSYLPWFSGGLHSYASP